MLMVQVKSGEGRATVADRETLKHWGEAFHATVEIWRFRKGKPLVRETVYTCDGSKA
jgi:hypothetical protein